LGTLARPILVRAHTAVSVPTAIAVRAKYLEAFRVSLIAEPFVEPRAATGFLPMPCALAADMINREEEWLVDTAAGAAIAAVSHDGLVLQTVILGQPRRCGDEVMGTGEHSLVLAEPATAMVADPHLRLLAEAMPLLVDACLACPTT